MFFNFPTSPQQSLGTRPPSYVTYRQGQVDHLFVCGTAEVTMPGLVCWPRVLPALGLSAVAPEIKGSYQVPKPQGLKLRDAEDLSWPFGSTDIL